MNYQLKVNIVSIVFAIVSVGLYLFFPINNPAFEAFIAAFVFLFILPILYTKMVLKKSYNTIGFTTFHLELRDIFFVISSVILGGLVSFLVVSMNWGTQDYISAIPKAVLVNFKAFAIYELFFVFLALFLFTFFAWGFVYSINWRNKTITYISSLVIFILLLVDFYDSVWIILPFLVPAFFIMQIRDNKNIIYLFIVMFIISLILDTLLITSLT